MHGAVQIGVQDIVPVGQVFIHVQKLIDTGNTGVVYKYVRVSKLLRHFCSGSPHTAQVADIAVKSLVRSAIRFQRFKCLCSLLSVTAENCDVGAGLGHRLRDTEAETAVAPGDHGVFAVQAEGVFHALNRSNHLDSSFLFTILFFSIDQIGVVITVHYRLCSCLPITSSWI